MHKLRPRIAEKDIHQSWKRRDLPRRFSSSHPSEHLPFIFGTMLSAGSQTAPFRSGHLRSLAEKSIGSGGIVAGTTLGSD